MSKLLTDILNRLEVIEKKLDSLDMTCFQELKETIKKATPPPNTPFYYPNKGFLLKEPEWKDGKGGCDNLKYRKHNPVKGTFVCTYPVDMDEKGGEPEKKCTECGKLIDPYDKLAYDGLCRVCSAIVHYTCESDDPLPNALNSSVNELVDAEDLRSVLDSGPLSGKPNSCKFGSWLSNVEECRCFLNIEINKTVKELFDEDIRFAEYGDSILCPFVNNYKDYKSRKENKQNECPCFKSIVQGENLIDR